GIGRVLQLASVIVVDPGRSGLAKSSSGERAGQKGDGRGYDCDGFQQTPFKALRAHNRLPMALRCFSASLSGLTTLPRCVGQIKSKWTDQMRGGWGYNLC